MFVLEYFVCRVLVFTSKLWVKSFFYKSIEQSDVYLDPDGRVMLHNPYTMMTSTLCSENWDDEDASVICRQTGMGEYGVATTLSRRWEYNRGLFDVQCTGSEKSIFGCTYARTDYHLTCDYEDDAGVNCTGSSTGNHICYRL